MRRINGFILYGSLALILFAESTFLRFNLSIIFIIFVSFFYGRNTGFKTGLAAGFIKDILGIAPFGANILIFGALGLFSDFLANKIYVYGNR